MSISKNTNNTNKKFDPHLPPGQMVDIGSCRLHCYASSLETIKSSKVDNLEDYRDKPTIVIEAGCGWHSTMYFWLQESLSNSYRVISYDRAGLGWSENHRGFRDAANVADELHLLLSKMEITGPILLVGHSIAGLYLRVFANRYPDNIVGMVLLDPSHPLASEVLPLVGKALWRRRLFNYVMSLSSVLWLSRLFKFAPKPMIEYAEIYNLPESIQRNILHVFNFPQSYLTGIKEMDSYDISSQQVLELDDLGDLPLLIVTAPKLNKYVPQHIRQAHLDAWARLQSDLLNISSNSQQIIIDGADHCTLITERQYAHQVAEEIMRFIDRFVIL